MRLFGTKSFHGNRPIGCGVRSLTDFAECQRIVNNEGLLLPTCYLATWESFNYYNMFEREVYVWIHLLYNHLLLCRGRAYSQSATAGCCILLLSNMDVLAVVMARISY